tara:strand:+ start:1392 stop:1709 length:318 start_codon:yes stop_codon:yes gene_type:complete
MKVEFYKHSLGEKEKKEINCTIDSLFLTTGPKTKEFEDSFAQFLEVDHCLGVTSWTMGNFITLKALGIGPGDKVLTTRARGWHEDWRQWRTRMQAGQRFGTVERS